MYFGLFSRHFPRFERWSIDILLAKKTGMDDRKEPKKTAYKIKLKTFVNNA